MSFFNSRALPLALAVIAIGGPWAAAQGCVAAHSNQRSVPAARRWHVGLQRRLAGVSGALAHGNGVCAGKLPGQPGKYGWSELLSHSARTRHNLGHGPVPLSCRNCADGSKSQSAQRVGVQRGYSRRGRTGTRPDRWQRWFPPSRIHLLVRSRIDVQLQERHAFSERPVGHLPRPAAKRA